MRNLTTANIWFKSIKFRLTDICNKYNIKKNYIKSLTQCDIYTNGIKFLIIQN